MKGKFIKRSLVVMMVVAIFSYLGFQVYNISFNKIKTEIVQKTTMMNSIETVGYIVRDEEQISTDTEGILNFILTDGEKVEKGGIVAEVYKSEEDILINRKLKDLDTKIQKLSSLLNPAKIVSMSPSLLDKQIHKDMSVILKNMNSGEYKKVFKNKNKLLYLINQRQLIVGKVHDFSEKIDSLNEEREKLTKLSSKSINNITTNRSGYFVSHSDGMEKSFNYKDVLKVDSSKVNELIGTSIDGNAIKSAKLVNNAKWYILSNVKASNAEGLTQGQCVNVHIPHAGAENIEAKIVAINSANVENEVAVVLECNYINKNILSLRKEPIVINIETYDGIRVDKRSIHEKLITFKVQDECGKETEKEKRVKGVYVVCGKQLIFKEVKVLHSGKNYVICSLDSDDTYSKSTVEVYDEIVVEGTNLYDRKIIK